MQEKEYFSYSSMPSIPCLISATTDFNFIKSKLGQSRYTIYNFNYPKRSFLSHHAGNPAWNISSLGFSLLLHPHLNLVWLQTDSQNALIHGAILATPKWPNSRTVTGGDEGAQAL